MTVKAWEHYTVDDSRTSVQNCQILQHRLPRHRPCFLGYQYRFPGDRANRYYVRKQHPRSECLGTEQIGIICDVRKQWPRSECLGMS